MAPFFSQIFKIRFFLFCCFFLFSFQILFFFSKSPALAAVDFSHLPEEIKEQIKSKQGFAYNILTSPNAPTPYETDKLLRALMQMGLFEELGIVGTQSEPFFKLHYVLLKRITEIQIRGNKEIDEASLLKILNTDVNSQFDWGMVQELNKKLTDYYSEMGFLSAEVQTNVAPDKNQMVILQINVQENQPLLLNELLVVSKNEKLNSAIQRIFKSYRGRPLNQKNYSEFLNEVLAYLKKNRFLKTKVSEPAVAINADKSKAQLTLELKDTEEYKINFVGNYFMSRSRLFDALNLESDSLNADVDLTTYLSKEIRSFYLRQGYAQVQVFGKEKIADLHQKAELTLEIKEGSKVELKKISMNGQLSRPEKYYIELIEKYSGPATEEGLYNREELDEGLKALVISLQNEGFLKARVVSSRFEYNDDKSKLNLTVNLNEGPLTLVREIHFEGNDFFPNEDLKQSLGLRANAALRLNELELGIERLKNHLAMSGFLESKVLNEQKDIVRYNEDNTLADIYLKLHLGPRIFVKSILIEGNTLTREEVIRRELDFTEGDLLTPATLQESNKRLQKLGLFSQTEIKTAEENSTISERTVVVRVVDRLPGRFNIGLGMTNERELTLRGFTGYNYRNLFGTARAFSTRLEVNYNIADIKYPELKLTAGYLEPYLLDSRFKGKVNFIKSTEVVDFDKREALDTQSIQFQLENQITSSLLFSYDIWSISTVKDLDILKESTRTTKVQNIATTGPAFELDLRDHPFNPTEGSLSRWALEYSDPSIGSSASVRYIKSTLSLTHYLPFFKKPSESVWVLANSIRLGLLENLQHEEGAGVPYSKKGFVLGGLTTIRGFEAGTKEKFPSDEDLGSDDFTLATGAQYALFKSEMRFPLYGAFGGVLFYDGGLVNVRGLEFLDAYRDSAGFGIRYNTPFGPVNLELAFKLDRKKEREESPYRFHFSIGTF